MTTYTIAYAGDALLAVVPDNEDIEAAILAVEEHTGEEFPDRTVVSGCTLTDDPTPDDHVVFASPSGACGWLTVREDDADVSYDYAITAA